MMSDLIAAHDVLLALKDRFGRDEGRRRYREAEIALMRHDRNISLVLIAFDAETSPAYRIIGLTADGRRHTHEGH